MLPTKSAAILPSTAPAAPASAGLIAPLNASFHDLPCILARATATPPATTAPLTPATTVPGRPKAFNEGPTFCTNPPSTPPTRDSIIGCTAGFFAALATIFISPDLVSASTGS